ncbi:SOS response-associated peptidase family protein [Mesorhizobium sp. BR1-1-16]|uniref:SOS response-associated peptidase n=1 Tax=Mesorhizobium sp. BR1-1-16 TaxID=2876653 RepID=UPI001CCC0BD1|nr:SOS response-associated peptidase family protein [Mesorhizobium sp. BR1-1-16]MBZ9936615.1 SOS response-associated peptidase family protein [Mesorhizobium sp. BR1-1-16]
MCNLYSMTSNPEAIRAFARAMLDSTGNLEPQPGIFPDYLAPIVRNTPSGRELARVRWGMPSSSQALFKAATTRADKLRAKGKDVDFPALLKAEPDNGTTNIRNTASRHWTRWLGVENRCVVPFTSFSEFNREAGGDIWFAFDDSRPLAFFAGIWVSQWTSVRKIRTGFETADFYGFLTTEPNAEVGAIHLKAMPVILTTHDEVDMWLTADTELALSLKQPLADGSLKIVARGVKQDL